MNLIWPELCAISRHSKFNKKGFTQNHKNVKITKNNVVGVPNMKSLFILTLCALCVGVSGARAAVPTQSYVDEKTITKVDTSQSTEQTMAGKYTVSGTLEVPTPKLPDDT